MRRASSNLIRTCSTGSAVSQSRSASAKNSASSSLFICSSSLVTHHSSLASSVRIKSLLSKRIAINVISILLPEPRRILLHKFQSPHPLHALPRIQLRHHQPHRIPMLRRQRLSVMPQRKKRRRMHQILERHIRRITLLGQHHHIFRFRLRVNQFHHFRTRHAFPPHVKPAPSRHAVHIRRHLLHRQPRKFIPTQPQRLVHQPSHAKIPSLRIESRHSPFMQHRPLQRQRLPRRQPSSLSHRPFLNLPLASFAEHYGISPVFPGSYATSTSMPPTYFADKL